MQLKIPEIVIKQPKVNFLDENRARFPTEGAYLNLNPQIEKSAMIDNIFTLKAEHIIQVIELISISINNNEDKIDDLNIGRYGRYDDFVYAEILQKDFDHLHVKQREAIMSVVRELINATSRAYFCMFQEYREAMEEMEVINGAKDVLEQNTSLLTQ